MAAIKKFFEKRKMNMKFKKAGDGHRLDEVAPMQQHGGAAAGPRSASRAQPSDPMAARKAADAALARLESKNKGQFGMILIFFLCFRI